MLVHRRVTPSSPRGGGGTRSIHDGEVRRIFLGWKFTRSVFFWVKRSVTYFFLGLKKIRVFFWVLSPSELFVSGFRCDQWIRKIFIRTFFQRRVFRVLVFFWVGNFDARYFFGSKFQACVFFWVCNMKLRRTPPSCILRVTPLGQQYFSGTHLYTWAERDNVGRSFLSKETTLWQGLGLEPATFRSEVQRANHYTTAPPQRK